MIIAKDRQFALETKNTSYCFRVMDSGLLEHMYYGRKIRVDYNKEKFATEMSPFKEKHVFEPGNSLFEKDGEGRFSPEDACLEMSALGKGDIREPFVEVTHADGSKTSHFVYKNHVIKRGKPEFKTLPGSYGDKEAVEHLMIELQDEQYELELQLHYYVYAECDVITRNALLINRSKDAVMVDRMMSLQLDLNASDYVVSTFTGAWTREMNRTGTILSAGKIVNASYTGTSSNRANPFVMIASQSTSEEAGECIAFNLIYSGNHYTCAEVNGYKKTRIVSGINPQSFQYLLEPGEEFEAPEAVMTYSYNGYGQMSRQMHQFVREHIVRGEWKEKERPILINSWEASYFDINESKLLKLAKAGKEVGIELFVMDDGWFGERNDDTSSLGDWDYNPKKLPNGVKGLVDKVKALGMEFGIWVEPEMVNVNSKLYRAHPEWVMEIPGKPHVEGRNQRILDLANPQVQDYIIDSMSKLFSSADITYVKWDMNRIFSDYYSQYLPANRQGEVMHRYQLGLYRCMKELTDRFPHILFEGCASGGNRFDLGILCYFPQIWASDDTDALCRSIIQDGYSYGYPSCTIGAHVSAIPNHQTLRKTPINTRFAIAAFGVLGYEFNLCELKKDELQEISEQVALYKKWRSVLQFGTFYRNRFEDNIMGWTVVSKDQKKAVGMLMQTKAMPNMYYLNYKAAGLNPEKRYHFTNQRVQYDVRDFGSLINTITPVHVKQDGILHHFLARTIRMEGEKEDYYMYGDALMYAGVDLKQCFGGAGYDDDMRVFIDYSARIYFMEEED